MKEDEESSREEDKKPSKKVTTRKNSKMGVKSSPGTPSKKTKSTKTEDSLTIGDHRWKKTFFKKLSWCDVCTDFLWGVTKKQGYKCKVCKMISHKKCLNSVTVCQKIPLVRSDSMRKKIDEYDNVLNEDIPSLDEDIPDTKITNSKIKKVDDDFGEDSDSGSTTSSGKAWRKIETKTETDNNNNNEDLNKNNEDLDKKMKDYLEFFKKKKERYRI